MHNKVLLLMALSLGALFSCAEDTGGGDTGTGGSMARFTIKGDYLYTVDFYSLNTFDISNPASITHIKRQNVGFGIETIFPTEDYLFLGAQNGMHIYGLTNPAAPDKISFTPHFVSYDPVVVQGDFAYVTLRSMAGAGIGNNSLLIFDISHPSAPVLKAEYAMTWPRGLGIDGDLLFVCDDKLKVFSVANGFEIQQLQAFDIHAIDVIPRDNILFVVAEDGFYQYLYTGEGMEFLSKLTL